MQILLAVNLPNKMPSLFVAVMVGDAPDTAVVPLASSTLLTNLSFSHSVFQCTSLVGGVSLTALLAYWIE